jgi:DHA2 family multidrug resistance protein-like MFS transporter
LVAGGHQRTTVGVALVIADEQTAPEGHPGSTPRRWVALLLLAAPGLLISLDFSVLTLAVPKVSEALRPTATQLLWMVDVYGFMLAGFLVTMGSLGDRVGRRRLLLMGASGFGAASALTAFSTGPLMFIGGRVVLGVAGATLLPSTLALVSAMFPDERERRTAIAVWSTSLPVGGAIGPLVGGALLNWFWWGAAFLIGVPVMAVLVIAGRFLLPESSDPAGRLPDLISVGLSLAAVVPIVYGLQEFATGAGGALPAAAVAIGGLSAAGFVLRQRGLSDPLVDVTLFRLPVFSAALAANLFSYFVILGMLMLFAQYLQLVVGLTALRAGMWTVPAMGGLIAGSLLTPTVAKRASPAAVISGGLVVATIGFGLLSRVNASGGLPVAVVASAIFALGLAPVTTLVVNLVLAAAPPERAGAASGLSETSTELGGALGIAVLGTLATAVYRSQLTAHLPPGIRAADRQTARNTLGGAIDVARRLPARAGHALTATAQHAFRHAVSTAAITSAVIVLVLAVTIVVTLRRAPIVANDLESADEPKPQGRVVLLPDMP